MKYGFLGTPSWVALLTRVQVQLPMHGAYAVVDQLPACVLQHRYQVPLGCQSSFHTSGKSGHQACLLLLTDCAH
jgi:hypothetical protein